MKDACEAAGVARRTFYRDLHVPYVVQMWAERARSQDAVLWEIVDRSLAVVMMNMATIAMNNEGRDGVQAARLFYEMYNNLSAKAELLEEDDERSDALDFLKGFGSKATYRAKRKRRTKKGEVTEEIEVLSSGKPPHSESSPVIDA